MGNGNVFKLLPDIFSIFSFPVSCGLARGSCVPAVMRNTRSQTMICMFNHHSKCTGRKQQGCAAPRREGELGAEGDSRAGKYAVLPNKSPTVPKGTSRAGLLTVTRVT